MTWIDGAFAEEHDGRWTPMPRPAVGGGRARARRGPVDAASSPAAFLAAWASKRWSAGS